MTQGRQNLQPLALQKASTPTDAGDSNGQSTSASKGAQGAIFNDILANTLPPQPAGGVPKAKSDQVTPAAQTGEQASVDTDNADADFAALTAASQFAARGVTLKAVVQQTDDPQIEMSIPVDAPVEAATASPDAETVHHEVDAAEPASKLEPITPLTDTALPIHALIQLVATVSVATKNETESAPQGDQTPAATQTVPAAEAGADAPNQTNVQPTPAVEEHPVEFPTPAESTEPVATVMTQAVSGPSPIPTQKPPEVSALRAVAWFKAPEPVLPQGPKKKVTDATATEDTPDEPKQLKAEAQSELAAAPLDMTQTSTEQLIQQEPTPPSAMAPPPVTVDPATNIAQRQATDAAAAGVFDQAAPSEPTVTPLQTFSGKRAAALTPDEKATFEAPLQSQPTKDIPSVKAGEQDSAVMLYDETLPDSRSKMDRPATTKSTSDIRGLAQSSPETMYQDTGVSDIAPPGNANPAQESILNKTSLQTPEARQLEFEQNKIRDDAKGVEQLQPHQKADVDIREIMKLGAADVSISIQHQTMQHEPQPDLAHAIPMVSQTSATPTPVQAAPVSTANVETNGERRTIADDIRLRALERMVVNAVRNGTQILTIQLYPPGLGQVVLRMAMDGQRLRLATRTATAEGADTLRKMEVDLRDALAGHGVHLAGFDVSEDGTNDDAPRRKTPEPSVKTSNRGTNESFTVDMNA